MKQAFVNQGKVILEEVPSPQIEKNTVLVQVDHSCISVGTELSGVKDSGGIQLWRKALKQPEKVLKVAQMISSHGLRKTKKDIENIISIGVPIGYSAAGTIIQVGEGISDLKVGDRVSCAGAQCAFHAEIIRVPKNLTVKIPDNVNFSVASTATVGAIALQGVRRAIPTLGETFVVIGLGILGQITVQLLKINGCRVIGLDLDCKRIDKAISLGMDYGIHPNDGINIDAVERITNGIGADGVIITAASSSDEIISTAFKMCRKKGKVILVGAVGLNLNRDDFYQKEIDFYISCSYGPGRYDNNYEEKGLDYPFAYVRWTEGRNLEEYLKLIAEERIKIDPLIEKIYPIDQVTEAYDVLMNSEDKPLMVLLSYPNRSDVQKETKIANPRAFILKSDKINISLVGAGGFAKGMHLPNIAKSKDFQLYSVMSRTGHNATSTAKLFGASYATTDYSELLNDQNINAILIGTRHNLHCGLTLKALDAGKHVLVEKPLCLSRTELQSILNFYESKKGEVTPILLTGFNRRFSKYAQRIFEIVKNRINPMIINYRMNAGYIPLDHWVHTDEGGGRNIGEACHIYDLFTFLTQSKCVKIEAQNIIPKNNYLSPKDNFVTTLSFEDGSICTLTYTAMGSTEYPKEIMEIYVDGKLIKMEDYKNLTFYGCKYKAYKTENSEKGQMEELEAYANTFVAASPGYGDCIWCGRIIQINNNEIITK
jgi:predicted dehydrogenase/threonine dehydrogenase-like Zn-dependent dehydrogenase